MNSVEKVKAICKERNIPISRLERDCGFSNGYISQLRRGVFTYDRLVKIADYLEMTPDDLANDITKKAPSAADGLQDLRDEDRALLEVARNMTREQVQLMTEFAKKMKGDS